MSAADSSIHSWLGSPLGQHLLAQESALVARALDQVFGLQLLQIGAWGNPGTLLANARTQRYALVGVAPTPGISVLADPAELCVVSDSVDAVVLPHTLELSEHPHDVLREIDRILVGEGHLLILGFNPVGPLGLRRTLSRRRFPPGVKRFIGERRMRDWLSLLGFDVLSVSGYFHTLPINRAALSQRPLTLGSRQGAFWSKLAGAYVLLAQKKVYTLTPIRPKWRKKRRVVGGLVEPTTRNPS